MSKRTTSYLTEQDVRNWLLDRKADDNLLDMDLSFSPEEIAEAMVGAARDFNSVPPLVLTVAANKLPGDTNLFLEGITARLYTSKVAQWSRNDFDYTAGGVTASPDGKRLQHLNTLRQEHRNNFLQQAADLKHTINLSRAWGPIG